MFCRNCGNEMDDNAAFCAKCGTPVEKPANTQPNEQPVYTQPVYVQTENIPNYLAFSIVVTILCCMPFGIPAIVYASQVNTKLAQGDIAGAKSSSSLAKTWCIVSFCTGLGISLIYLILFLAGVVAGR